MVHPIFRNDEYDIDLVCRLVIDKDAISKADLKKLIGDRLKKRGDLKDVLSESRRAWTLDYPSQFHMDVLSSIPNQQRQPSGILLPDKELHLWQKSNPIAYADSFYDRMKVIFQEKRAAARPKSFTPVSKKYRTGPSRRPCSGSFKSSNGIATFTSRTIPTIVLFSIIITTLAARAYRNQAELFDALIDVVKAMPNYIEKRGDKWWVQNPVERDENFADRWNEYPDRRQAFFDWLARAA